MQSRHYPIPGLVVSLAPFATKANSELCMIIRDSGAVNIFSKRPDFVSSLHAAVRFYSARKACIGSIVAARFAGHQAANNPVSRSRPHMAANVSGSRGAMPKIKP
jgi:hypothetical protein